MQRRLTTTALIILWCAACATVVKAPTEARLVEAQKAFDEGLELKKAGKYAEAVPLLERALELRESVLSGMHPQVAQCLSLLGDTHSDLADYARAEPLLTRALEIREATLGENHPDVGESVNLLAVLYYFRGNYTRAESLMARALKIREATLGENHPDVAASLNNLASLYMNQGLYARAEPPLARALEIMQTAFGENHPQVATPLHNLANLYMSQGLYARAEPLSARALEIRETALGENHPDVAASLHGLAHLYMSQGHYARAEPLMARVLQIREATLGENHPDVAISLNNLANIYQGQGLYARAEPLLARSLAIQQTALGENHPDVATPLHNLANIYQSQGLHARAEPLLARALQIKEAALGEHHPQVADTLHNLAYFYMDQGLHARAEPLMERALAIRKAALGEHHPQVASSLHGLARLYFLQGSYARAEPLYAHALKLWEAAFGEAHPDVANVLDHFARLRLAQQNLDAALPLLERAFTISEQHLRQELLGLSEKNLDRFLHRLRAQEERVYALARAHPGDARVLHLALSAALLRKGRSLQEVANTSLLISRNLGPSDRQTFERLRGLRTQLASLSIAGPGQRPLADYAQHLKELAAEGDLLEADLARRSAPLRALTALPSAADMVDRVAQALPKDGALVELIAYEDKPLVVTPGTLESKVSSELRYLALVLFPDSRIRALDLGPAAPIDQAASSLRDALARRDATFQAFGRAFYQRAFRPLLPLLGGTRRLILSPDGQFNLVPFAALHDGRQFLLDSFDFTYVTSGKDLLSRAEDIVPSLPVAVFADPDFNALPPVPSRPLPDAFTLRGGLAEQSWVPLPGSRQEAEMIQRLLPGAQVFLGPEATKEHLLNLPTPSVLHIATHGFFLGDASAPRASRALGHFGALGEGASTQLPADPLLRSGLALAGAGARASTSKPPSDNALVTALELGSLNLWGTELVVLSACDTGRGDITLGQGVYGLRRALVAAGAETVVMSLWKVNDDSTRLLMEAYYRNLLAGQGRASALREAMRSLRVSRPHPHHWAPFIAQGRDAPLRALVPLP